MFGLWFRKPASPGWGLGWVCLGTGCGFAPPFPTGVCGVCGWACVLACIRPFWVGVLGRAWLCARSACTPPFPARVCGVGVCAWARLRLRPATPSRDAGVCVCLCARPAPLPAPPGWGCGAGVCAWAWVAAAPRQSWLGCWGVCVFVCAPRLYPAIPGRGLRYGRVRWARFWAVPRKSWLGFLGVCAFMRVPRLHPAIPGGLLCVCVCLGFLCSSVLPASWLGCWGAWPLVCAASVSRHLLGGRLWRGVCGCCPLVGSALLLPFNFSYGGGRRGVSCRGFVVLVAGCSGLGSRGLPPPFPSRSGCAFVFFLFFFPFVSAPAWCVSACSECPFFWWAAALGLVSLVLAGWSFGVCSGGPVFGAVQLGGLAASCGVSGWFLCCGPFSCPPLLFFFLGGGSACSWPYLPWADARTGRHSVWSTGFLLVLAFC